MKTLICDTSFRATKLLEKILVKLPQISEIVVAHELVEVKKVLKANKIQVVFLSLDFAQVINKKTLLDLFGKVPVILLLQPRVKPFFSPEILLISDGIVLNNATDLEFQIVLAALKIDLGQKIVESKLIKPKGNSPPSHQSRNADFALSICRQKQSEDCPRTQNCSTHG